MTIEKRISSNGNTTYRAKVRLKGFPPATATFTRKTDAQRWMEQTRTHLRELRFFPTSSIRQKTVADLIIAYLADLKVRNPRRHTEVSHMLRWWHSEVGKYLLTGLTTEVILRCQHVLSVRPRWANTPQSREKLSAATVNRYVVAFQTALKFGVNVLKWSEKSPADNISALKESSGRTRFASQSEILTLLKVCKDSPNESLFAIVLFGIATGARRTELQSLRWSAVSADGNRLTFNKTKNGEIRSVAVTGKAHELLLKMLASRKIGQAFLFPSPSDPTRPVDFRTAWRTALKKAKISNFRFHDLRHTCGSYLAMNGATGLEIAEVLGHKTLEMARRYAHLTETHTTGVVGKMTEKVLGDVDV